MVTIINKIALMFLASTSITPFVYSMENNTFSAEEQHDTISLLKKAYNACCHHDVTTIKQIFNNNFLDVNAQDKEGKTMLMYACACNQPDIVQYLLTHDTLDINKQDAKGLTALIYASWRKNLQIIQILLGKSADANRQDTHGFFPLYIVANLNAQHLVSLLMEHTNHATIQVFLERLSNPTLTSISLFQQQAALIDKNSSEPN